MKAKNIGFTLGKKELQKIKALCDAFKEIVAICERPSCLEDYKTGFERYYEIVDIINIYEDNWG